VEELNGKYTIFGQCDQPSIDVVTAIARVPRNADDKPLTPVRIEHVTIVREGEAMPPAPPIAAPAAAGGPAAPAAAPPPAAAGSGPMH
jgi:peptidyl-prolyl cis-trans isomerase A (cyclophilin A)